MSEENAPAARLDDHVAHTAAIATKGIGAGIGMLVGLGVGIGLIIVTAPTGIGAVAAALATVTLAADGANLGAWLGEKVASYLPDLETGDIKDGASTVFVGADLRPQARIEDDVMCMGGGMAGSGAAIVSLLVMPVAAPVIMAYEMYAHATAKLAEGCITIFVENRNAAREGCLTTCGAKATKGEKTVLLGKGLGRLEGYPEISETGTLDTMLNIADWVGAVAGVTAAFVLLAAATTVGGVIAPILGIFGFGAKISEAGGGSKVPGYADEVYGIGDAIRESRSIPTNVGKGVFIAVRSGQILLGGGKVAKRTEEVQSGPKTPTNLPVIPASR